MTTPKNDLYEAPQSWGYALMLNGALLLWVILASFEGYEISVPLALLGCAMVGLGWRMCAAP